MRFKISWASLIAGSKCTVFALFYFVFEGNFQVQALGELIFEGVILRKVFCVTSLGELIHEGAYFRNFTVSAGALSNSFPSLSKSVQLAIFLCLCSDTFNNAE